MHTVPRVDYGYEGGTIGVVSDTHVPARSAVVPPALFRRLNDVSLILHAGDLEEESVLRELGVLAPIEAVAGNMDPPELKEKLGIMKIVTFGGVSLGIIHGHGPPQGVPSLALKAFSGCAVQAIIFGHSHQPFLEYRGGVLMLNPGSPVDPRGGSAPSCACLTVEGGKLHGEIMFLE